MSDIYDSSRRVVGFKGDQADKSFASSNELNEDKDWQDYKKEKKLSFAASKVKEADNFKAWRKARSGKKTPSPPATGEPIVKTGM